MSEPGTSTRLQRELAHRGSGGGDDAAAAASPGKSSPTDGLQSKSDPLEAERDHHIAPITDNAAPTPRAAATPTPARRGGPEVSASAASGAGAAPAPPAAPATGPAPTGAHATAAAPASARPTAAAGSKEGGDGHPAPPPAPAPTASPPSPTVPPTPAPAAPAGPLAPAEALRHQVQQVAPADPSPARTTVGVGERVQFSSDGDGTWTATAASGGTTRGAGRTFTWAAPDRAASVAITHERAGTTPSTIAMTVVAPDRIEFRKTSEVPQAAAGVGMVTNLHFFPDTVSFARAEWQEQPGPVGAKSGYFEQYVAAGLGDLAHHPAAGWIPMGAHNTGVDDSAYTREKPPLGTPGHYSEGMYQWQIPNKYRVAGEGEGYVFANVEQTFTMDGGGQAGRLTVSKGGQQASQSVPGVMEGGAPLLGDFSTDDAVLAFLDTGNDGLARSLLLLPTLRARDPAGAARLVSVLRRITAPPLYVGLTCANPYSWFMGDDGRLTVQGNAAAHQETVGSIHSGTTRSYSVPFLDLFDLDSVDAGTGVTFTLNVEGRVLRQRMALPLTGLGRDTAFDGGAGHYLIRSFFSTRAS
ncbi:MAG: hypothetical protein NT062_33740 [Proteobacteria bacterium]|nr:hypothetical protein [Pseudomonadota bacterium]